jgi:hypothetical protein
VKLESATFADMCGKHYKPKPTLEVIYDTV